MAARCELTGKGKQFGNKVSFSLQRNKRVFKPNLQRKTFVVNGKKITGAYTLTRLRLSTIARACQSTDEMVNHLLPKVAKLALSTMDKRHKFLVEESNFFNTDFLVKEGFIKADNFTSMIAIVGLADATNHLLQQEGIQETKRALIAGCAVWFGE